jgi:hypothetical protein
MTVEHVLALYKEAAVSGGEVHISHQPRYLLTEYIYNDKIATLRANELRCYYERKLGLFEKFYQDRVEQQGDWNGVTTTVQELGKYRYISNDLIVAAFLKDVKEARGL